MFKIFSIFLLGLIQYVLCDDYKNSGLVPRYNEAAEIGELMKNEFDHVKIIDENYPRITINIIRELGAMKNLDIESCQVRTIETGAFAHLVSLKKLSLKNNLLEEIKYGSFSDLQIEELDLSKNQIRVIEERAFEKMKNLRSIDLKNNKIEVYNSLWFQDAGRSLCSVNFENNLIKSLSNFLFVSWVFRREPCHVDAIFSHNRIENVSEEFFSGLALNRLYLDHNAITVLPRELLLHSVEHLRLDNNKIVCTTLSNIGVVQNYSIEHNPWDQECLEAFKTGRKFQILDSTTSSPPSTTSKKAINFSKYSRYVRVG